jgi:hypothetical protein
MISKRHRQVSRERAWWSRVGQVNGGVRLRCGPSSAELLPQLERRATMALGQLSDDNLTVPAVLALVQETVRWRDFN